MPRTIPVSSRQSNGMAEAFVRTLKRDYVRVNPTPDAKTVIEQMPSWLAQAHYDDVRPHRVLGYSSPREYSVQTCEAPSGLRGATTTSQTCIEGHRLRNGSLPSPPRRGREIIDKMLDELLGPETLLR